MQTCYTPTSQVASTTLKVDSLPHEGSVYFSSGSQTVQHTNYHISAGIQETGIKNLLPPGREEGLGWEPVSQDLTSLQAGLARYSAASSWTVQPASFSPAKSWNYCHPDTPTSGLIIMLRMMDFSTGYIKITIYIGSFLNLGNNNNKKLLFRTSLAVLQATPTLCTEKTNKQTNNTSAAAPDGRAYWSSRCGHRAVSF